LLRERSVLALLEVVQVLVLRLALVVLAGLVLPPVVVGLGLVLVLVEQGLLLRGRLVLGLAVLEPYRALKP